MTEFQPPLDSPAGLPIDRNAGHGSVPPGRWSAAAISGFVLSFLGCTGIGAVFGLILGVVGIVKTGRGRLRGRGLAIAAIPISILTSVGGFLAVWMTYTAAQGMYRIVDELPGVMGSQASGTAEGAEALLGLATSELRQTISADEVVSWLERVKEVHGKLVEATPDSSNPGGRTPAGEPFLNLVGKFVNGRASVKITFDPATMSSGAKLVDIEVDGVSLRESE